MINWRQLYQYCTNCTEFSMQIIVTINPLRIPRVLISVFK